MSDKPLIETQASFAKRLGVAKSYVTALKQAGRLVMTPNGKRVDVDASMLRIEETADPNRDDVAARWARTRGKQLAAKAAPAPEPEDETDDDPVANESFANARARKMAADANMAELELRKLQGLLAEVASVRKAGADIGALVRTKIENMIQEVTPLVAPNDQPRARAILIEHAETALLEISHEIARAVEGCAR